METLAELIEKNKKLKEKLAIIAPKAEAFDVLTGNTDRLFTVENIANNYDMSVDKFNTLLHELGVQYKQDDSWYLYAKYNGNGYTAMPTCIDEEGNVFKMMKWTTKGEYFLYELLKKHGYESTAYDLMFKERDNL